MSASHEARRGFARKAATFAMSFIMAFGTVPAEAIAEAVGETQQDPQAQQAEVAVEPQAAPAEEAPAADEAQPAPAAEQAEPAAVEEQAQPASEDESQPAIESTPQAAPEETPQPAQASPAEEPAQQVAEPKRPALDQTVEVKTPDGKVRVRVTAPEGSFAEGTTAKVTSADALKDTVLSATEGSRAADQEVAAAYVLDVRLVDAAGTEVAYRADRPVHVSVSADELSDAKTGAKAFAVTNADGKVSTQPYDKATRENGTLVFDATTATTHAVILTRTKAAETTSTSAEPMPAFEQSKTVDGVKVTVEADEGTFPEGATLSVKKVSAKVEQKVSDL